MRISDWSSDVCSSDLGRQAAGRERRYGFHRDEQPVVTDFGDRLDAPAQYDATQCIGPLRPADIDSKRTIAGDNVAIAALARAAATGAHLWRRIDGAVISLRPKATVSFGDQRLFPFLSLQLDRKSVV